MTFNIKCAILFLAISANANAQNTNYLDSLSSLRKKIFVSDVDNNDVNPYFYKMFGKTTFYKDALHEAFTLDENDGSGSISSEGMAMREDLNSEINKQLMNVYAKKPNSIALHEDYLKNVSSVQVVSDTHAQKDLDEILSSVPQDELFAMPEDLDIGLKIEKPNFWKKSGTFGLQFSQNYFSDNWYKGGDNNQTMLSSLLLEAKYDDTKKLTWENKLELRLGFVTSNADTCHQFITNNDKINLYSKLGIKMAKSWYYAASVDTKTQFMPGYKTNDIKKYSQFLAPLDFTVSLGLDFKPQMKNNNSLSVAMLPLSYKFRYVGVDDDNIRVTNNMTCDFRQDFGSKIEFNAKIQLAKNLSWKCRFFGFTSYEYVESELENIFSFNFSKYISAEIFSLWRFDDNRGPQFYDDHLGYFQFKEYVTFGLNYSF